MHSKAAKKLKYFFEDTSERKYAQPMLDIMCYYEVERIKVAFELNQGRVKMNSISRPIKRIRDVKDPKVTVVK